MYKLPANDYQRAVEDFKREWLAKALVAHGGNRSRTARALGLQRTFLLLKCQWRYPRCPRG